VLVSGEVAAYAPSGPHLPPSRPMIFVVRVDLVVRVEGSGLRMWAVEGWNAAWYCRGGTRKVGNDFIEANDELVRACVACLAWKVTQKGAIAVGLLTYRNEMCSESISLRIRECNVYLFALGTGTGSMETYRW
jgi:hypothetical protein